MLLTLLLWLLCICGLQEDSGHPPRSLGVYSLFLFVVNSIDVIQHVDMSSAPLRASVSAVETDPGNGSERNYIVDMPV